MYRNLIWDLDGTLFDTYPAIARSYQKALSELQCEAPLEWIEGLARHSLGYCTSILAQTYRLDVALLDTVFGAHYDRVTAEEQPPLPGVIEVCRYICSLGGKNVIVTHRERASSLELLTVHRMSGFFTGCITRDEGHPRKPDPAAMNAALAQFKLRPSETLAIGDREIDVLAGRAAGLSTCLYGELIEDSAADFCIATYSELYRYLAANT